MLNIKRIAMPPCDSCMLAIANTAASTSNTSAIATFAVRRRSHRLVCRKAISANTRYTMLDTRASSG